MKRCANCMHEYKEVFEVCPKCGYIDGTPQRELYYLKQGTLLDHGRYYVGVAVGSGGFGTVYRAWDNNLEQMVAIKEYYPANLVTRVPGEKEVYIYDKRHRHEYLEGKDRFLEEARCVAKFSESSYVVNVFNFFEENNTAYCVMEFMDGIELKKFVKIQGGKLSEEYIEEIVECVLDGLKEIHKSSIIHRDIAPDNLYVLTSGKGVKIFDFGAARLVSNQNMTTILKPGYAPVEQYTDAAKQGPWTDLYALGAVMYYCTTGVKPPESTDRLVEDHMPEPKELNPDISDKLNNIIMRAMAMQPELRFQSAEEFLDAYTHDKTVLSAKQELKKRRRRRIRSIILVAVVLFAGIIAAFYAYTVKRAEAGLRAADLDIWIVAGNDEKDKMQDAYNRIAEGFREIYPQIQINVEVFTDDEYEDALNRAMENGMMPDIFQSDCLGIEAYDVADIQPILDKIEMADYIIGVNDALSNENKRMPISFCQVVLYVNTSLQEEEVTKDMVEAQDPNASMEDFLSGELPFILADTSFYPQVRMKMMGRHSVRGVPAGISGENYFDTCFSINEASTSKEKKAAYVMIEYLLSTNAQYFLCIENNIGLPLNRGAYDYYMDVNSELDGLPIADAFEFEEGTR